MLAAAAGRKNAASSSKGGGDEKVLGQGPRAAMSAYVYVLGCDAPSGYLTYVGWTLDLDRRLGEHNSGGLSGAKSTRGRVWSVIYAERLPSRNEAMSREWHLKRDRRLRRGLARAAQGLTG